ncbi:dentin sialophosphoprotein [Microplitis demolitor]|uniref:dentin sialophosphoprotein n=1 Tax=Microplitis demolitor TaxID=69319 RepID=UPI0004CD169C|nr:dentin sialophosphoprotein [Microplitis demolitor]
MITQGRQHKKTIVLRPQQPIWCWKTALFLASLIYGGDYVAGQGNNFKCREEGYQADPRDCHIYYRCVSWGGSGPLTTFRFECGPGTVFSHSKGDICVHPRDSERSECSDMGNDINSVYEPQQHHDSPSYPWAGQSPSSNRPHHSTSSSSRPQHYPGTSSTASRPQHHPQHYPSGSSTPTRPQHRPQHPSSSSTPSRPQHRPQQPSTPSRPQHRPQYPSTPARPQYLPPPTESPDSNEVNPEVPMPIRPGDSNHRPTTAGGGRSQCQGEGFMAHPKDCKKFVRCVNDGFGSYTTYEFSCGEGTVWDSAIEGCNHAWAVKSSCEGSSSQGSGPGDDNSQYPSGNSESDHSSQGPSSNYPSQGPDNQNKEPEQPGQDSSSPDQDSDNPNEGFESPDQDSGAAGQEPDGPSQDPGYQGQDSSSPDQESDNQNKEPKQPDEDSAFPDQRPSSPYPLYPPGPKPSSSSPTTPSPPAASTVRQPLRPRPPSTDASPTQPELPEAEAPKPSETPSKPGSGSGSCNEEGFFPDPQDCHKFFRCVKADSSFTKYEFECGEGTAWDQSIQTCNYEYAVSECGKNAGSPSGQTTPSSDESQTSSKEPDKDQSSSPPPVESSTEEEKQTSAPSSTDSSDNGDADPNITPSTSTSTSPSASSTPDNTETSLSTSTEEPSSPTEPSVSSTEPDTSDPSSSSTSPTSKEPTTEPSTADLTPTTAQDTPSTSTSASTSSKPSGAGMSSCQEEGFFPNPSDCRKFYRCVKGDNGYIKYDFDCAPGTAWEQSLLTCNYIHLVASCGSEANQVSSPEEDGNKDQDKDKPASESTEKPKDETSDPSSTTESSPDSSTESDSKPTGASPPTPSGDSSNPNKGIVCNSAGFYGHPTKCDKFYRCVDNGNGFNVYHFDCPPGTIYDPSLSLCNYPESVYPARDCSGQSPAASPSPSSSTNSSQEPPTTPASGETTGTTESPSESTTGTGSEETTTSPAESSTTTPGGSTESPDAEGTTTNAPAESTEGVTGSEMTTEGSQDQTTVAGSTPGITESPEQTTAMEMATESGEETTTPAATEETTEPESTTPAKTDVETGFVAPCPIVGNLTDEQIVLVCPTGFRRHPKYCNMFYQCTSEGNMEIKILVLACPDKTIFDEKQIQCVPESESSQVCNTEMASARLYRQLEQSPTSPIKVKRESLCPDEGHYPFEQGCSNAFYKCKKDSKKSLQGYLYKCPKDFVYWSVSRRCERKSRLSTCSNIKNEDSQRITSVENRWELPIEDHNLSARMLLI